jgi:Uma2 family endonuclease
MSSIGTAPLTVEQYLQVDHSGQPTELVRGEIVMMPPPGTRHGRICVRLARLLDAFVEQHDLGHVIGNDAGVVTTREPDSVRGPDLSFYSYARLPRGEPPEGYASQPPDMVFEVRSPTDRWPDLLAKVAEFLRAGVTAVCVVDPESETVNLYHASQPTLTFSRSDDLRLPPPLDGFVFKVARLFR